MQKENGGCMNGRKEKTPQKRFRKDANQKEDWRMDEKNEECIYGIYCWMIYG